MRKSKPDIKAAIQAVTDRGEALSLMEPVLLPEGSRQRGRLTDLALDLVASSAGFRRSLPEGVVLALTTLVRAMNCHYSNLIEGHHTHPVDIERALKDDFSSNREQRNLQLEARAHIAVQEWIDGGGVRGRATTTAGLRDVHRRFGERLPEELLWVDDPETGTRTRVAPGEWRQRDVKVGRHIPISPGALPRFLDRFEHVFTGISKAETLIAAAAAHHRLLWIHPFLDGNGRVVRLMSHAMLIDALDSGGVWSIARGLARNVVVYKSHLSACDQPRRNDLDGRGHLSEEALAAFSQFFLETCLDQVRFMENLVQPNRLRGRILAWAAEETRAGTLPAKAGIVLEAMLFRGELARGEIAGLLDLGDRQARRIVAALIQHNVLTSASTRAPLRLAFPARLASYWMPGLFPDATAR